MINLVEIGLFIVILWKIVVGSDVKYVLDYFDGSVF